MHRYWDAFLTDESSVEEGCAVVSGVAVVHSSNSKASSANNTVANSSNKTVADTDSMAEPSNDSVTNSSHQSVSNEARGDNTDSPHPVGADTMGGARVVGNSSDRGSESL